MLDHLERPKPGFERVIAAHFSLKKGEVLAQVDQWVKEAGAAGSRLKALRDRLAKRLEAISI